MNKSTAILVCVFAVGGAALWAQKTNVAPPQPPVLPPMPRYQVVNAKVQLHDLSPVAYFRVLLGMTPEQRARALADKPEADRDAILRKVGEYTHLPPDVRDERLRQTELRWTLVDLMKSTPAQRPERLRTLALAPSDRAMVEGRLRQWDRMPAVEQKAYLEKQDFISLYLRWQAATSVQQTQILQALPPARRSQFREELARWQTLPETERQETCARFARFVELDQREQTAIVSPLSETERQQMERSLQVFANLSPADRRQCVQSFGKFATMSLDERNQFLRNAAQWEAMTPKERQTWRRLVQRVPVEPPWPPGFETIPANGLPPMPPGADAPPMPPAPRSS